MADEILRIGAEFDVSQIVSGTQQAVASFDNLGSAVARQAATFQKQGLSIDETKSALQNLGYSLQEVESAFTSSTQASESNATALGEDAAAAESASAANDNLSASLGRVAVASDGVSKSSVGMVSAMGAARVEAGALDGSMGMMVGGLARVAAQSQLIAPLIQAAFIPFAAFALIDVLSHVAEGFDKAADQVVGYTKAVQEQYAAEVKFSTEAMGHAQTLEEAQRKLADTNRTLNDLQNESFSSRYLTAIQEATQETSTLYGPLQGLVIQYRALSHAEADAADEGVKLVNAQRSLMAVEIEKEIDLGHEAIKLIDEKLAAQNSANSGDSARVASIRNEIAALKDQQSVEEETAAHEANLKALREGGNAVEAAGQARSRVAEEFYYKRIELTNQLGNAETELARIELSRDDEAIRSWQTIQINLQKEIDFREHLAEEEKQMFASSSEKDVDETIRAVLKRVESQVKYEEETTKLAEESATRKIGYEESAVTATAKTEQEKLLATTTNEFARIRIVEEVNAQELAQLRRLEDEKIAVQLKYLQDQKNILLGGQTEQQFTVNADPEQLTKLAQINSQIEAAQQAHNAKMGELDQKAIQNTEKAALDMQNAWLKIFAPIDRAFNSTIEGILKGTQTAAQAFQRMGQNIELSVAQSLAKVLLLHIEHSALVQAIENSSLVKKITLILAGETAKKTAQATGNATEIATTTATTAAVVAQETAKTAATIAGEAAQTTAVASGEAAKHAVEDAAAIASTTAAAGLGAAWAFASVLAALPFPENVAVAPAVAAAEFGQIEAIGLPKAEQGALVPKDMAIHAHAGEMILPQHISSAFQAAIPAIGAFSSSAAKASPGATSLSSSSTDNFSTAMSSLSKAVTTTSAPSTSTSSASSVRGDTHIHIAPRETTMSHDDIIRAVRLGIRKGQLRTP